MRIPVLDSRLPIASLRRELRYTLVRLRQRSWTKTWVTVFEGLLKEAETVEVAWRKLMDTLEDAEAERDEADLDLDRVVLYTGQMVRTDLSGGPKATLLKALFGPERPSDVIKPKLGEELKLVRTWPDVLASAPLAKIVAQKAVVDTVVKRCDAAEKTYSDALSAVNAYRVKTLAPLFDKVNGERQALGGEAKKQAFTSSGRDSGEGLFRTSERSQAARPTTLLAVQDEITQTELELAQLKERQAALQADKAKSDAAEAERHKKEQEVKELERVKAEADHKLAALKEELEKGPHHGLIAAPR